MLDKLIGRGAVEVHACQINSPKTGNPIPAVYVGVRERWMKWRVYVVDLISFLIIAEKLAEHKEDKDFVFEHKLDNNEIKMTIPAWAIVGVQERAASIGPKIYQGMKQGDEMNRQLLLSLKGKVSEEEYEQLASTEHSAIEKYKKLHAQVNGYTYIATAQAAANDENKNKTLHSFYHLTRGIKL
jgi:hypothetical protein